MRGLQDKIKLVLLLFFVVFVLGCNSNKNKDNNEGATTKVQSTGIPGELYLFIDTACYKGPVGEALKTIFNQPLPGLINDEPSFTLNTIDPTLANRLTLRCHTILYCLSLEHEGFMSQKLKESFDKEVFNKLTNENPVLFLRKKEVYSYPQTILYFVSRNDIDLKNYLLENKESLFSLMQKTERDFVQTQLAKQNGNLTAKTRLKDSMNIELAIPASYKTAKMEKNLLWLRNKGEDEDKNLLIYTLDYKDTSQFSEDSIITFVDSLISNTVFGSGVQGDSATAMILESRERPFIKTVSFKDKFAKEVRGIWKLRDNYMGGVFVAYLVNEPKFNRLIFFYGFTFAPNKSKREKLREMEAIFHTYKPWEKEIKNEKSEN